MCVVFTEDEQEDYSPFLRMVFDKNLGFKAALQAATNAEIQLGIVAEAECTQIDDTPGLGSGLSVIKLYESPEDAAKMLSIDPRKGLLLESKVMDTERGGSVPVEKEVYVMVCRLEDEGSLGGFAAEREQGPREPNKQVVIQRAYGAVDLKGGRALEHRREIANKILESIVLANPEAGARLLMDGLAVPLENDSLKMEGKKFMVGWMVWVATDKPINPPADGRMLAGYGVGKNKPLVARWLSLHPSRGARGFTALSWPGYKSVRGGLVSTSGGGGGATARAPNPQPQEAPQVEMPPPPDQWTGGRTYRGSGGAQKREGFKDAYARAREGLDVSLHSGFDGLLQGWSGRGSPPCFAAAIRIIKEGDHNPCKEGTTCCSMNKFYPCCALRGGGARPTWGGGANFATTGAPPPGLTRDARGETSGAQEERFGPVQARKHAVAGSEWVREAKEHREKLVQAGMSEPQAAMIAMATQEREQARLNEQVPEPQVHYAQQAAVAPPARSAAEVARECRDAREGKPAEKALYNLMSQIVLMKRRELSIDQMNHLAETQFKSAMDGAARAQKGAADLLPAWQKEYDEEVASLKVTQGMRPRDTSAVEATPSQVSSGSASPLHSKQRSAY